MATFLARERRETWATREPSHPRLIGWLMHLLGRDDGWVPGLLAIVDAFLPIFKSSTRGGCCGARLERADLQVDGVLSLARALAGRPARSPRSGGKGDGVGIGKTVREGRGGWARFYQFDPCGEFLASELRDMLLDPEVGVQSQARRKRRLSTTRPPTSKTDARGPPAFHDYRRLPGKAARIVGDSVIRETMLGLGYPFWMLIEHLVDIGEDEAVSEIAVGTWNSLPTGERLTTVTSLCERARGAWSMQSGDAQTLQLWRLFVTKA